MSDDAMNDDTMRDDAMGRMDAAGRHPTPACATLVDARLADYLDDAPDPALVAAVDSHVATCARCAALVSDLNGISAAARSLPPLAPSRDLWTGIAERIGAPATASVASPAVVPIDAARRRRFGLPAQWRSLAAAAALVMVTAGVTYELTKNGLDRQSSTPVASADGARPSGAPTTLGPSAPKGDLASSAGSTAASGNDSVANAPATTGGEPGGSSYGLAKNGGARKPTAAPKSSYDVQIDALRRIVRERRSQLDPATLAVLEKNIAIIDQAIAQSRAALAHDPRSRFLDEQLNDALDKKLDLLRTAALLPART
ncbi:MAG TPA: zf-HC2 domain-containing protein [Gemmatimonadaceae bacterium]|nr:zf-HC2 domain-containing protein [Gemmatimonadaceae bacterium]